MSGPLVRLTTLAVAMLTSVGVLVALGSSASAQTVAFRQAPAHVSSSKVVHPTSTNWAGWDNTGSTYTNVSASWTQPSVNCASTPNAYSSFWVGLDGDGSGSVEQTGTEADCSGGSASYSSWYEFYPAYPVNYANPVSPGDQFTATVNYGSSGEYTLTLTNSTEGWTKTTDGSAPDGENASAEVIAEAPSSSTGVLPLANFGTVQFTNATVDGAPLGTVPTAQSLTMASGSTTKASVSALSGNDAFSATWLHQ